MNGINMEKKAYVVLKTRTYVIGPIQRIYVKSKERPLFYIKRGLFLESEMMKNRIKDRNL